MIIVSLLLVAMGAAAESRVERSWQRHEVRVGWGDQFFEMMAWREDAAKSVGWLPASTSFDFDVNYRYTQHVFAEYQYRFNSWFGFGGMADGSGVMWDRVTLNGKGEQTGLEKNHHFYNIVVMPTVRFTYFWHDYVNIYSGLGLGLNVNGGTEEDMHGHKTVCAPAVDIRLIGLSVNYQRYFINVDFGGMYSLLNMNTIFMLKSRMLTASFGVRL